MREVKSLNRAMMDRLIKVSSESKVAGSSVRGKVTEFAKTVGAVTLPPYLDMVSGASVALHEGGHAVTQDLFFEPGNVKLQVDAWDNLKAFTDRPSISTLFDVLTVKDAHSDGASGYAAYRIDKLTPLGDKLGLDKSVAITAAAGCTTVEALALLTFIAAFKLRDKHPTLATALASMSLIWHVENTFYALSALWMKPEELRGHDWITFSQATGIHPAIPAALMGASLPALAAALYLMERRARAKALRRAVVSELMRTGAITQEKFRKYWNSYSYRDKVERAEAKLERHLREIGALIDTPQGLKLRVDKLDKRTTKLLREVLQEYNNFIDYVADKENELVTERAEEFKREGKLPKLRLRDVLRELARGLKENLNVKRAFKRGKLEGISTALTLSSLGLSLANLIGLAVGFTVPTLGIASTIVGLSSLTTRLLMALKGRALRRATG